MVNVGEVALKIAGRDAGKVCAIVESIDDTFVVIDGETRRRKCNIKHLEFLGAKIELKKSSTTKDVISALKTAGFSIVDVKKGDKREKTVKQKRTRKVASTKTKVAKESPKVKVAEKKEVKPKKTKVTKGEV